jgi:hypothetical protein
MNMAIIPSLIFGNGRNLKLDIFDLTKLKHPTTGQVNLLCGAGNFGKIWSACGQREIQFTK